MKKIAFSLITSFALIQSVHGATSALSESLLEYEAITTALGTDPAFQSIIPPSEFVTDIKRTTNEINMTGEVKYRITTEEVASFDWWSDDRNCSSHHHHRHHHHRHEHENKHTYVATLLVVPNSGIGPNIISVLNIMEVNH